jgi:iron complex outermembrane receptor protein
VVSLAEALDRVASAAHVRVSYSSEYVPLSQPACATWRNVPLGLVLFNLLNGTNLHAVLVGSDQIVVAPTYTAKYKNYEEQQNRISNTIGVLNRVVVTGSANGASERGLPIALNVITGQELAKTVNNNLSTAMNGSVPGMWLWDQSPLSVLARYGSIRGASSFGVSYPKVYIDGIEVANSLLITQIDPNSVARIEVIRGPQGAALYGADAISGVVNIITKQEGRGSDDGRAGVQVKTSAGNATSDYAAGGIMEQNHAALIRAGDRTQSARMNVNYTSVGAFIPGANSRTLSAGGGGRIVRTNLIVTGTARLFAQDARTPASPLLGGIATSKAQSAIDSTDNQKVREFTLGTTATLTGDSRWTHSATAGVDGYSLTTAALLYGAFPSSLDSALRASDGSAIRASVRASSVGQFENESGATATVTAALEQSYVHEATRAVAPFANASPPPQNRAPIQTTEDRTNTGVIGQVNGSLRDTWFGSVGLRAERNTDFTGLGAFALLPMVGASYVYSENANSLKFRAAYGKGIRPPKTTPRAGTLMGLEHSLTQALSNEEQAGTEFGADLFARNRFAAHVTRFDQLATGLIQPVAVAPPGSSNTGPNRRIAYVLQNVGEISNRGWELSSHIALGTALTLSGTFTQTDSRVQQLAKGYTGDLRIGDRMLEVPAHTYGVGATLSQGRFSTTWNLARASDWINYDRIALAAAYANSVHDLREFVGPQLRTYWRSYSGNTTVNNSFSLNVRGGTSLFFNGANLLNEQTGEPDNITVLPGRSGSVGLRASF